MASRSETLRPEPAMARLDELSVTRRRALVFYFVLAAVLFSIVAFFGNSKLPLPYHDGTKPVGFEGPLVLEGWARFDAGWYRSIAENGYYFKGTEEQSSVAFFPLYPLTMRLVQGIIGADTAAVGILITFLCGAGVAVLFATWNRDRMGARAVWCSLAALLLWPYSWYLFGAVYAEALFLLLVLGAFVALERDRLLLAAVLGALASASRPVGLAVAVGLLARQLERTGAISFPLLERRGRAPIAITLRRARPRDFVLVLASCGLLAYMGYLWVEFDEPFAFAIAQGAPGWEQKAGPQTWFKIGLFERVLDFPNQGIGYTIGIVFQGLLVTGVLLLTPRIGRRFGWGYALYVLAVLAIPYVGSKDFQGIGRYALAAFPAFAVMGESLSRMRPRRAVVLIAGSAGVMLILLSGFSRGAYVA